MLAALGESGLLAARVLPPLADDAPLSNRLHGFSFWESRAASDDFLARHRRARLSDGVLLALSLIHITRLSTFGSISQHTVWSSFRYTRLKSFKSAIF